MGLRDQFPHTLVPLDLAVLIVQQGVYGENKTACGADPNAIASYIAATVPLYEVAKTATTAPRILINIHHEAVFNEGGKELVFLDGRRSTHLLAIPARDVPCIIAMLKEPQRAQVIRREAIKETSRRLVKQSRELRTRRSKLVEQLKAQMTRSEQLRIAYKVPLTAGHFGGSVR